jgi:tetratricopeptide (TPR) repeat protein
MNAAAAQLEYRLNEDPMVHAAACFALGRSYSQIGRWETSRKFLEKSLPIFEEKLGPPHRRTIQTNTELASVCLSLNDHEAAERYCVSALYSTEAVGGTPERRLTRKLAQVRIEKNNPKAAEIVILRLLELLKIDPSNVRREELEKKSLYDLECYCYLIRWQNANCPKVESMMPNSLS